MMYFLTLTISRMDICIRARSEGLGVDYDEKLAGKFPYQRAYLPVNRKLDGTIFNW